MSTSRAKFKCTRITHTEYGTAVEYRFSAVCADEVPENQRFHRYTPSGTLSIWVDNPNVMYELGKCYYLDFSPA